MLDPSSLQGALIWGAIFAGAALFIGWIIGRAAKRLTALSDDLERRARIRFLLQIARLVVFLVFFVLWAHLIPELRAFGTALLASASVMSIVLGIAAQNTLGNLIAGISILMYRPFQIGDRIQISAPTGIEVGTIESINLSHTVITTFDNRRITVPNGQIMTQTLVNLSSEDPRVMAIVTIPVAYDTDLELARRTLTEICAGLPEVLEVVGIPVTQLATSSVNLSARLWCADAAAAKQVEFAVYERALTEFAAAGIEIPYPWSNVILHRPPDVTGE